MRGLSAFQAVILMAVLGGCEPASSIRNTYSEPMRVKIYRTDGINAPEIVLNPGQNVLIRGPYVPIEKVVVTDLSGKVVTHDCVELDHIRAKALNWTVGPEGISAITP